jgi:menaquinone-dependent protoporphyrinogen oxidase
VVRKHFRHDHSRVLRQPSRSNGGIAEHIAARIAESGETVDLRHVDAVRILDGYDTVVFGAPVYDQCWPPEADQFITANREALAVRPLWLFGVGAFGDTKRVIGPLTHKEPNSIADVRAALHPHDYRVFQGVVREQQWPYWSRGLYHALGGRFGDHRDWPVIDAWAEQIAASLSPARPATPSGPVPPATRSTLSI